MFIIMVYKYIKYLGYNKEHTLIAIIIAQFSFGRIQNVKFVNQFIHQNLKEKELRLI